VEGFIRSKQLGLMGVRAILSELCIVALFGTARLFKEERDAILPITVS
jgi:hypothetical protein